MKSSEKQRGLKNGEAKEWTIPVWERIHGGLKGHHTLKRHHLAINLLTKAWQLFHKTPPQAGCRPAVTNTQQVMHRYSDPSSPPTPAWSFFTSTPFRARQWKVRRRPPRTREDGERLYLNHSAGQPRHGASGRVGDIGKPPPQALLSAAFFHPPFGLCYSPISLHFTFHPLPSAAPSAHQQLLFREKQNRYRSGLNGGGGIDCCALLTALSLSVW